jgi:DNA-binding NtrC family response regulator
MTRRTVLISDDNRSAADALCKLLRREGYDAHAVYDGQSAIDRLQNGGVEIVLTELKLAPVDGMAVLRAAKAESDPPIVLVFTGYGTVETAVQAMHLGALHSRLAVLVVDITPLRDRIAQLPLLIECSLKERSDLAGREAPRPPPVQSERLRGYHWPGNLREATAACERALVFGPEPYDLPEVPGRSPEDLDDGFSLSRFLENQERRPLEQALRQTDDDRSEMSPLLGVARNTVRYKLNKHDQHDRPWA